MDIFSIYIATFFIVFLIMPTLYFALRFLLWFFLDYCGWGGTRYRNRHNNNRNRSRNRQQQRDRRYHDRHGNIYTVSDDAALNNASPPRFADFFYLEPGSEEAARIRAQLEKDDKELPSYDEVIRMTTLTPTSTAIVQPVSSLGVSTTSIATNTTDISLPPVPPYTEIDINATLPAVEGTPPALTSTVVLATATAPSTSRAAVAISMDNTAATTSAVATSTIA